MATIPAELAAAKRALAGRPLKFGDPLQIGAVRILSKWVEVTCAYCDGCGFPKYSDRWIELTGKSDSYELPFGVDKVGSYPCHPCEGTGKVLTRR